MITSVASLVVMLAPASVDSAVAVEQVIVQTGALDFGGLARAMRARLPGSRFLPYSPESFEAVRGAPFAYADLSRAADDTMALTVILSDGRSYARQFAIADDAATRTVATVLANTLTAIAEERVAPTADDAEIPEPEPRAPASQDPEPTPPEPTPESEPEPDLGAEPERPAAPPSRRRLELGLTPALGAGVAFGRGRPPEFAGGMGALGIAIRFPVGAVVSTGVRYGRRRAAPIVLHRARVHVGAGYNLRLRDFELQALGAFAVEPWRVTADERVAVTDDDGRAPGPLLGGFARVAPGWFRRPGPDARVALRLGTHIEVGGTGLASGGVGRLVAFPAGGVEADVELARLGGFEVSVGVDVTLWLTLRER